MAAIFPLEELNSTMLHVTSMSDAILPDRLSSIIRIHHKQQNAMECWWKDSTSTAIPSIPASDVTNINREHCFQKTPVHTEMMIHFQHTKPGESSCIPKKRCQILQRATFCFSPSLTAKHDSTQKGGCKWRFKSH